MQSSKKWWHLLANKFLLTGAAFIVWMMFFDQNNWQTQRQRKQQLESTEQHIRYLSWQIQGMEDEYQSLRSDPRVLERFAREHYRMKKDNEDVYIPVSH